MPSKGVHKYEKIYLRYPIPKSPPSLRAVRCKSPLDYLLITHDLGKGLAVASLRVFYLLFYRFLKRAKLEKDWEIFYKNIYFCKSFSAE